MNRQIAQAFGKGMREGKVKISWVDLRLRFEFEFEVESHLTLTILVQKKQENIYY